MSLLRLGVIKSHNTQSYQANKDEVCISIFLSVSVLTCPPLSPTLESNIDVVGDHVGSAVTVWCVPPTLLNHGLHLDSIMCGTNAQWNRQFTCEGKYYFSFVVMLNDLVLVNLNVTPNVLTEAKHC